MAFLLLNQKPQRVGREFLTSITNFLTILGLKIFNIKNISMYLRKNQLKKFQFFYRY
jgi:hypothetical protein